MKIVHLVANMGLGGLERVVVLLSSEMVRRGHQVTICCYDGGGCLASKAEEQSVVIKVLPRRPGVDVLYVLRLAAWLKRLKPDILHVHTSPGLFYGICAGRLAGIRTVMFTKHDGCFPRRWVNRWVNRWLVRRLTHAVAVSEFVQEVWCQEDAIEQSRVHVVVNGVEAPLELVPRVAPSGEHFRIGSVGRLSREKGIDVLLEAFAILHRSLPLAELFIVGDGPERVALERIVVEKQLSGCVQFMGMREDIPTILRGLDAFAFSTRHIEGLGLVNLEAMAAGTPVVANNIGGVGQAVKHEHTGLLVKVESPPDMASALLRLLRDRSLWQTLSRNGQEAFAREYTVKHMVDRYERVMGVGVCTA